MFIIAATHTPFCRMGSSLASLKDPKTHALDLPAYDIPSEKLNRRRGAIALGHPVGATGARLIRTALHQLRGTNAHRALATLCIGGDPEEIDRAMLDFGMPMGPLRLLDEVGLDVAMHVARTLAAAFPGRMEIPRVVEKLLEAGHTGRKGGSGFYVYDQSPSAVNAEAISCQTVTEHAPENTQSILASLIMEEAKICLAEGVAESADDIDLAMILGTGYPPFRGGPLANMVL